MRPRETREAKVPGLEDGPDNPLSKRRRDRQREIEEVAHDFEQTKEGESPRANEGESTSAGGDESPRAEEDETPHSDA